MPFCKAECCNCQLYTSKVPGIMFNLTFKSNGLVILF